MPPCLVSIYTLIFSLNCLHHLIFFEKKIYFTQKKKSTKKSIDTLQNLYTHTINIEHIIYMQESNGLSHIDQYRSKLYSLYTSNDQLVSHTSVCFFLFVLFQLYIFFFIINTVFVLLMYACSSVYVFFLLCYFIYFVCVFSISLSDLPFFVCLPVVYTCIFIIVINLRFGTFLHINSAVLNLSNNTTNHDN